MIDTDWNEFWDIFSFDDQNDLDNIPYEDYGVYEDACQNDYLEYCREHPIGDN